MPIVVFSPIANLMHHPLVYKSGLQSRGGYDGALTVLFILTYLGYAGNLTFLMDYQLEFKLVHLRLV